MSTTASPRGPRTVWEHGRRSAREVVALVVAMHLTAVVLDLALSDGLGLFHDLVFVTLCVAAALLVAPTGFLTVALTPPLAMFGVVLMLALTSPEAIADAGDGVVQATASGVAGHGVALALGYGACLALLGTRSWLSPSDQYDGD